MARYSKPLVTWTDERIERLKSMWTEGKTALQIANALGGITRGAVSGKVDRLGLASRSPGVKPRPKAPAHPPAVKYARPFNPMYTEKSLPTALELEAFDPLLIDGKPITVRTCTDRTCKWICGEPSINAPMCGRETKHGTSWCEAHAKKFRQPQQAQNARQRQAEKTAGAAAG